VNSLPAVSPPKLCIRLFIFPIGTTAVVPQMSRKKVHFMDVGMETRVARSPRLMALAVSGVVKTVEGSTVNPSSPPPNLRKLRRMAIYQDDLWPRPTLSCNVNLTCAGRRTERMQPEAFDRTILLLTSGGLSLCLEIFLISVNCEWSDIKWYKQT
jgi:hypothetical protein